jgi:hypothetical protein
VDAKHNDKLKLSIRNIAGNLFLPPEGSTCTTSCVTST